MSACILVLNCGSSSIKFALFDADTLDTCHAAIWRGEILAIGSGHATVREQAGVPTAVALDAAQPYHAALLEIRTRAREWIDGRHLAAVAHRVVHGGSKYVAPTRVTLPVLAELQGYIPLAPLHQPFALEAIGTFLEEHPDVPQVACFDTAFHHTIPQVERMLPLPYALSERGLRRYGFHGLSYEYMAHALPIRHGGMAKGRTIVAHLGSGASLCAMQDLASVATTMGFSALDGLMMGTRCGAVDPGVVLHLMEVDKLSLDQVGHLLYHASGLLGVSGVSADPRALLPLEDQNERCRLALALYVRRIVREIGALVAVLGGLDMLVFTAGIGEHNAVVRERVMAALTYLGVVADSAANAEHAPVVSAPQSRVLVAVEPTNEEWVAARHALACTQGG
ncbi:acetate/propionate family kinase [Ralstonia pickettii]|uniref:acetate/propionate family kinase n=1 Tax=Ralstonia pickettii TaxID=329 RepID=UPI0015BD9A16|nr:acetate/propionate family kinase [Ralstonia pickettii]NWK44526.1 acetate/propionate family kinase [Ralstonia pickettii]